MGRFGYIKYLKILIRPWKIWLGGIITIVGFYDLFLSQFLQDATRSEFPTISDLFIRFGWDWYIWVIIFLFFLLVTLFEGTYRYGMQFEKPPEVAQLCKFRSEGVAMRNEGEGILHQSQITPWWNKHLNWRKDTLDVIKLLDVNKGDKWNTLDTYTPKRMFPNAFNADVRKKLQMFDEWLRRLDKLIDEFS